MTFSLKKAEELSPKRIRNMMVRDIDNLSDPRAFVANEIMPLYQMGDINEVYQKISGTRLAMPGADLNGEPEVRSLEAPDQEGMDIYTFKERISPEKFVDGQINSQREIINIGKHVKNSLLNDLKASRSLSVFHGYNGTEGLIGEDGATAHSEIPTDHVFAPSAGTYDQTETADPHDDIMYGKRLLNVDGEAFDQVGDPTVWASASTISDWYRNADLESRFSGVRVQNLSNAEALTTVLPVSSIREVRTKLPRTNDMGQPIDDAGNVVDKPKDAVKDNILEPYDSGAGTNTRNVIMNLPGVASGCMPWMTDRLASHAQDAPGKATVDPSNAYMIRRYTETVTMTNWHEIDQEIGSHLTRPSNWVVIQDV